MPQARVSLNILKIKRDINEQDLTIFDVHVVKSEYYSPT